MSVFKKNNLQSFTLVEVVIVMGILFILFAFSAVSLIGVQQQTSLNTSLDTLVSDLKSQQLKALVGDTEGRDFSSPYGIHFSSNNYVLFHGTSYTPNDTTNFTIPLTDGVQFTNITLPNSEIIFNSVTGEVNGFTSNQNTLTIQNTASGQMKTITMNRYGIILAIQ
ncbi:hypothetical protein A2866_05815 [Candidatus Roizmanbacteria bacterium RIFCSPHIGHO2_01_FULL_39_8]|nr:MAG: hypothetical protein A2866_05815 [Candidatus Roizmanbacteria bacterium RIFCSPHIGHO2_01_FULL_39_8]